MKVLIFAPYIYDCKRKEFAKTSSGFGYMVNDIVVNISTHHEVYLLTHQFTEGYNDIYMCYKHTKIDFFKGINFSNFVNGMRDFLLSNAPFSSKIRYMYYWLNSGSIESAIDKINPDIVHIHGLTFQTKPVIEICLKKSIRFMVTLHGLIGLDDTVHAPLCEKKYERYALEQLFNSNIYVSVISTGIKERIENSYGLRSSNIKTILNGTNFKSDKLVRYKNQKIKILCIGSLSENKNQMQLIEVAAKFSSILRPLIEVHFLGANSENIDIVDQIRQRNIADFVYYHGFVERDEIKKYWAATDFNIVMSKNEGFGLSIIEGFTYGVPTITFSDLDAVKDLYNVQAMELIENRDDFTVFKTIMHAIKKQWDREYIRLYSSNFNMVKIANDYNMLYRSIERK